MNATSRTETRRQNAASLAEAFARAEREQLELQRLKALHPQFSGLHFRRDDKASSC